MRKVKVFPGELVKQGADIALKSRLYVSGWDLSDRLKQLRKGTLKGTVALTYEDDKPVAVAVAYDTFQGRLIALQAFCRKSERRRGYGTIAVDAAQRMQRNRNPAGKMYWSTGIDGSRKFWQNLDDKLNGESE
jgi:hypothetical protein